MERTRREHCNITCGCEYNAIGHKYRQGISRNFDKGTAQFVILLL